MQAITIAIGKTGIQFFTQYFLVPQLSQLLAQLAPSGRTISVPDFNSQDGDVSYYITNLSIGLSQGKLVNFKPGFQNWVQGVDSKQVPTFNLNFQAPAFSAQYNWNEAYHLETDTFTPPNSMSSFPSNPNNNFPYIPGFPGLTLNIAIQFQYDQTTNTWDMTASQVTASLPESSKVSPNIPGDSILQEQDIKCFSGHVDGALADSIGQMNFNALINGVIHGVINSIPGSGNLGNGILYDFTLGDSGLLFPGNDGIQMGVTGGATYNGAAFSGPTPPSLPLPAALADTDTHHLNMYVSNYEVDALNWAFFKAAKLNTVVNAADLQNPDVLKVKTYASGVPALQPYAGRAMQATIVLNSAPQTAFQLVYELSGPVMTALAQQLPAPVYDNVSGLQGNNYVSQANLESDLTNNSVPASYFPIIEKAAQSMGMVVTHDITYTLLILDFQPTQPTIVFNVQRVDILSGLSLGLGGANGSTQTFQFLFTNVTWTETFISTSIPGLDASVFNNIWGGAGETQYVALLQAMGKTGTPLPIMQGFKFDFTNAILSIQENYVSILANVQFDSASAIQPGI